MNPPLNPGDYRFDEPPRFEKVIPLLKIKAHDHATVVLVSSKPQGFYGHWNKGKTQLCTAHKGECQYCEEELPRRWNGFLHVLDANYRASSFLEVTLLGRDTLKDLLAEQESWVGRLVHVSRSKNNVKSPLVFSFVSSGTPGKKLPKEADVFPTLKRVWRCFG